MRKWEETVLDTVAWNIRPLVFDTGHKSQSSVDAAESNEALTNNDYENPCKTSRCKNNR